MADYNATLWALLGPMVVACFQVQADAAGTITTTAVQEFNRLQAPTGFDAAACQALQARYGDQAQLIVVLDGGIGFEQFRRGSGVPPQPSPSAAREEQPPGLWDEPAR